FAWSRKSQVLNHGSYSFKGRYQRSEEHTSELQSQFHLVCRLLLEKKKNKIMKDHTPSCVHGPRSARVMPHDHSSATSPTLLSTDRSRLYCCSFFFFFF